MLKKSFKKGIWLTAAIVFLTLALIGLLLPVIPQTPSFLAGLFCLMRCSTRFNAWMNRQTWFMRIKSRFHRYRR